MKRIALSIILFLIMIAPFPAYASDLIHHNLMVTLRPDGHRLIATDSITLPRDFSHEITFTLHAGLKPVSGSPMVVIVKQADQEASVPLEQYKVILPEGLHTFTISYEGTIDHPVDQPGKPQAVQSTPGTISKEGVYLSADSHWYPNLGPHLITFDVELTLPAGWDAVSQGERTYHDNGGNIITTRWRSAEPQDGIFIIAAKFVEYTKTTAGITAMAFLRTADEALAARYLDATAGYLAMYGKLIGPYPYKKFALVENFWETGFGMPSFTLLGPAVIRLPFIVNTSYPHEILHNWWGNSVYANAVQGNWTEGLTAYLSDHLMKEMSDAGAEYRATALQKYADYTSHGKDFPLTQFRSRHSSASEAIGYGKSLMFFHMLRQELGNEAFTLGLRDIYKNHQYRFASFDDLRASFESVSGKDLSAQFNQWVRRTGAPQLRISRPAVAQDKDGFLLTATLEQVQPGEAYNLNVPVAVTLAGQGQAHQSVAVMTDKKTELSIRLNAQPLRLDIDPEFDLFRKLDRSETPPAVSQALGARKMLIVLPSAANKKLLAAYRAFAKTLSRSGPDEVEVKLDSKVKQLPQDRAVAVLGWENRFAKTMAKALSSHDVAFPKGMVRIGKTTIKKKAHSFAFAARLANKSDNAALFLAADLPSLLDGLGRKLPHYHKYSYLAFEGKAAENTAKGRWLAAGSPLTVFPPAAKGKSGKVPMGSLASRDPLATLDPLFSKERMMKAVQYLSSPGQAGRGFGSEGLERSADFIVQNFEGAGLVPGGDSEGSWFQAWEEIGGDPERAAMMKNVVGVIPGRKQELRGQSVVIAAHYDHLGTGWPETRDKAAGKTHPGADDNASGVAVLLELARVLAQGPAPDRTVVFVAFTGEEAGRLGSKHYAAQEKRHPVNQCIGMLNLDSVGRLGKKSLQVLGAGSAKEWAHLFQSVSTLTGVKIEFIPLPLDEGDQKSFLDAGVPAIRLFSGMHPDYHRSTDTADKLDADSLAKAATVAKEAIDYLANRELPLTSTLTPTTAAETSGGTR